MQTSEHLVNLVPSEDLTRHTKDYCGDDVWEGTRSWRDRGYPQLDTADLQQAHRQHQLKLRGIKAYRYLKS